MTRVKRTITPKACAAARDAVRAAGKRGLRPGDLGPILKVGSGKRTAIISGLITAELVARGPSDTLVALRPAQDEAAAICRAARAASATYLFLRKDPAT